MQGKKKVHPVSDEQQSSQEKLRLYTWSWLFNYIYCKQYDLKGKYEIILTSFQVDATLLQ